MQMLMTIRELIEKLSVYDDGLDVAVAIGEEDGMEFRIEASDLCVFFVVDEEK